MAHYESAGAESNWYFFRASYRDMEKYISGISEPESTGSAKPFNDLSFCTCQGAAMPSDKPPQKSWKLRPKFRDWKTWQLIMLGIPSFLISAYWLLVLGEIAPDLARDSNSNGFTLDHLITWFVLGVLSLVAWFFGCLAARCNSLLYERNFD